jgi:trigger factor
MSVKFETSDKENSQVGLKITVPKSTVKEQYEKIIKKAQKEVQIKGFRKGKVPLSVLEMKHKDVFLSETANTVIDEAFKEIYEKLEKKPLGFSTPQLAEFSLPELEVDYSFELVYDVYPEITYSDYKSVEVEKDDVTIEKDDIEAEIETLTREFATIEQKASGKVADGNIVYIDYTVSCDGEDVFEKEGEYIHVGKDFDRYKIGSELIGLKKDEESTFEKSFGDDEPDKELAGKSFSFKVKVNDVKEEKVPELTDDLAQEVDDECKTVDDLKKSLKKKLTENADMTLKQKLTGSILDTLIESFEGVIPDSMIKTQLEQSYQNVIQRFGGKEEIALGYLKQSDGINSKEEFLDNIREDAIKTIKRALILHDIVKKEEIKVSDEDLEKFAEPIAKANNKKPEELINFYKQTGYIREIENELENQKAVDFLVDAVKVKKGKKIKYKELVKQ